MIGHSAAGFFRMSTARVLRSIRHQSFWNGEAEECNRPDPRSTDEPLEALAQDGCGNAVAPFVLAVRHVVAERLQAWHELAAGVVDRHYVVADPVRDEDARLATHVGRSHQAGRERDDLSEHVTCTDAQ